MKMMMVIEIMEMMENVLDCGQSNIIIIGVANILVYICALLTECIVCAILVQRTSCWTKITTKLVKILTPLEQPRQPTPKWIRLILLLLDFSLLIFKRYLLKLQPTPPFPNRMSFAVSYEVL